MSELETCANNGGPYTLLQFIAATEGILNIFLIMKGSVIIYFFSSMLPSRLAPRTLHSRLFTMLCRATMITKLKPLRTSVLTSYGHSWKMTSHHDQGPLPLLTRSSNYK